MVNISRETRIERYNKKHNNTCDYSQLPQKILSDTVITITCKTHNHTYTQLAGSHHSHNGCKKCVSEIKYSKFATKQMDYINYCIDKFGNKFDYSKVNYINAHTPIIIQCNNCGFEKEFSPNKHKRGKGYCLECEIIPKRNRGFYGIETYNNRRTTLYYIKVNNVYKIGVTLSTVEKRYSQDKSVNIEIIKEWVYEDGSEAYLKEQSIIKTYKAYKYNGMPILKGGNSELFTKNILNL